MNTVSEKRQALIQALFPAGVPRLWCPLLTHYRKDGRIDFDRMSAHFHRVVPWVKGFLIPGSTGDGWELDEEETAQVTEFAMQQAQKHEINLLLGVLKADTEIMIREISGLWTRYVGKKMVWDDEDTIRTLRTRRICGFTVCPPRGKELSQKKIETSLVEILELGAPIALYQLPQVTENEVSPDTFENLIGKYANLIFFKDSSGQDRIAESDNDKEGVYMVRGAEGNYAGWLRDSGGPYDGFLLSTANCFARELYDLIRNLEKGDLKRAGELSERLSGAIRDVFALVQPLPCGNAFTNANKAIDHFFAFGPAAVAMEGPTLHAKVSIPADIIAATGEILSRYSLMPEQGYLA